MFRFLAQTVFLFVFISFFSFQAFAQTISEIRIQGAQRIEPSTVLSYMGLSVGDPLEDETLNRSLKRLFATGLFADIKMQQDGAIVIVDVKENPIINDIFFEGNEEFEDQELLVEIQQRPRQVFTRTRVQSDISRMYDLYSRSGRFSVSIEPKIVELDQNRVNLIFEVNEGDITKVKSIRFVGNEAFDDSRLRREITTKEAAFFRFFTSADRYDPDRLSFDQELLRQFYLSEGYADFQVLSAIAELSEDRQNFFITITVEEGPRYKLSSVSIDSRIQNFDASDLGQFVTVEAGEWYNADKVQNTIDELTDALGDQQYAFVDIAPEVNRAPETKTIDLIFVINETNRVFVERVNVNGNVRTLDKVIRREMNLVEGDPFNRSKLARSEQNIRNLDFFDSVEVDVKKGSAPDKTVVDIGVSEKSTGEISVGAGFSTTDGPLADIRLRERNFLGKGQNLLFATTLAGERTQFDFSFTEPYFLNRDVSAGFDLFFVTRDLQDESSFDQERRGGALRIGYPWSDRIRQTVRLRLEQNDITDVQDDASRFISDQEGQRDTYALSQRLTYDSRDSRIFPTDGWLLWLDTEVTGFGGDSQYVSAETGASYYYEVFDNIVFNVLGEVGAIEGYGDQTVTINERFFLGGTDLRGFEQGGVGPRDLASDDALGGNRFYRTTAELSFPLGLPEELGIRGHTFADAGSLFDVDIASDPNLADENSIRASVGAGASWRSPFGPIRVDFAKSVAQETFDEEESFRFNFGTQF